jgi:hypothetical protein
MQKPSKRPFTYPAYVEMLWLPWCICYVAIGWLRRCFVRPSKNIWTTREGRVSSVTCSVLVDHSFQSADDLHATIRTRATRVTLTLDDNDAVDFLAYEVTSYALCDRAPLYASLAGRPVKLAGYMDGERFSAIGMRIAPARATQEATIVYGCGPPTVVPTRLGQALSQRGSTFEDVAKIFLQTAAFLTILCVGLLLFLPQDPDSALMAKVVWWIVPVTLFAPVVALATMHLFWIPLLIAWSGPLKSVDTMIGKGKLTWLSTGRYASYDAFYRSEWLVQQLEETD